MMADKIKASEPAGKGEKETKASSCGCGCGCVPPIIKKST